MGNSRQVVVATNMEATEAHLLRGRLEAEGVRSWVDDEHTSSVYPMHGFITGGVKVKVHVEDEALARQLMYGEEAGDGAAPTCPDCGAAEVGDNRRPFSVLLALTIATCGLYLPLWHKKYQCGACGFRW